MHFRLLSPMVISTKKEYNGNLKQSYFRCNQPSPDMSRIVNDNIRNKYELIYNSPAGDKNIIFEWDNDHISNMEKKGKRVTRKQTIKHGTQEETEVIGNMAPFYISGDKDLVRTGCECGFGEKNSLGFGLAEPF